jgi:hypothetical protein
LYNIIARNAQHLPEHESTQDHTINLNYLHQLSGNDPQFEREILKQFLIQTPDELNKLELAIAENDFDRVKQMAHTMKSTVGYIGLTDELQPYLHNLEESSVTQRSEDMERDFHYIKTRCETAMDGVKVLLDKDSL